MRRLGPIGRLAGVNGREPGRGGYVAPAPSLVPIGSGISLALAMGAGGVQSVSDVSLGSGIGLGLGMGDGGVVAVAGGPVWTGGGYWESDGTAYLVGPSIDLAEFEAHDVVVQWSRAVVGSHYPWGYEATSPLSREYLSASATALIASARDSVGTTTAFISDVVTGAHVLGFRRANISGWVPGVWHDAGSVTTETPPRGGNAAGLIYVGAAKVASVVLSAAGLRIFSVTIYRRTLSDGERAAIYSGGAQISPLSVAADAWSCWDMRGAIEVEGVMKVPDLVLGDGTRDLAQVNGTSARFGVGAFA